MADIGEECPAGFPDRLTKCLGIRFQLPDLGVQLLRQLLAVGVGTFHLSKMDGGADGAFACQIDPVREENHFPPVTNLFPHIRSAT